MTLETHEKNSNNNLFFVGSEQLKTLYKLDTVQAMAIAELHDHGLTPKMLYKMPIKSFSVATKNILRALIQDQHMAAHQAIKYFNDHYEEFYHKGHDSVLGKILESTCNKNVESQSNFKLNKP